MAQGIMAMSGSAQAVMSDPARRSARVSSMNSRNEHGEAAGDGEGDAGVVHEHQAAGEQVAWRAEREDVGRNGSPQAIAARPQRA